MSKQCECKHPFHHKECGELHSYSDIPNCPCELRATASLYKVGDTVVFNDTRWVISEAYESYTLRRSRAAGHTHCLYVYDQNIQKKASPELSLDLYKILLEDGKRR